MRGDERLAVKPVSCLLSPCCQQFATDPASSKGYLVLKDVRLRCSFAATDSGGIEGATTNAGYALLSL